MSLSSRKRALWIRLSHFVKFVLSFDATSAAKSNVLFLSISLSLSRICAYFECYRCRKTWSRHRDASATDFCKKAYRTYTIYIYSARVTKKKREKIKVRKPDKKRIIRDTPASSLSLSLPPSSSHSLVSEMRLSNSKSHRTATDSLHILKLLIDLNRRACERSSVVYTATSPCFPVTILAWRAI